MALPPCSLREHLFLFFVPLGLCKRLKGGDFLGRKSHYVQTVNHKDVDFLNALRCSGVCTKNQATKNFISANRLKNFVLDKTLEKCTFVTKEGKRQEVYRISNEGKTWIRDHIPEIADRKFYSSTGVEHDLKIMYKIISLSREERLTLRSEGEIRDEFKQLLDKLLQEEEYERYEQLYNAMQNHTISMPDLAYGVNQFYEVVTSSYLESQIMAKFEAVSVIGGNLQMERI